MLTDHTTTADGRIELLAVVSFLGELINAKVARHGGGAEPGCANENRRDTEE